jgi:uncharacterized linocin/CFP29 family protein
MHADLANLGWTEEQWNRITSTVTEEAQRARVAAQVLPTCGPEDPSVVAVPKYALSTRALNQGGPYRLEVDINPTLALTTIAVNVYLRSAQMGDPSLQAALVMFRRAANIIGRLEDALVMNGWAPPAIAPTGFSAIDPVHTLHGDGPVDGLLDTPTITTIPNAAAVPPAPIPPPPPTGNDLVTGIVQAISKLETRGGTAPFACFLSNSLFEVACCPTNSMVMPRDRLLPILGGPLVRSSAIDPASGASGVVVALSGDPVEIVVASDIHVRYLQATEEPRYVFRVSERVALRVKDANAVELLQ